MRSISAACTRTVALRDLDGKANSHTVDPLVSWNCGVQMVGLNMQHINKEQLLNYGMFRKNGGYKCGRFL